MKSPTPVEVYLGIPDARPDYVQACRDLGAPIMISGSAFARPWTTAMREASINHPGFKAPPSVRFAGIRVALDSMGFTAMRLWGGYPVTPEQYFHDLAKRFEWSFWSSQDLCCEPEVSSSGEETVARIMESAWRYDVLCDLTKATKGVKLPMKILQGWDWHHYLISAEAMNVTDADRVIGIGSICKRQRGGPDGVLSIIERLDAELPKSVRFHLFGVTSTVLEELANHPRVASMDSQAWGLAMRKAQPTGRSNAMAIEYMARFYRAQQRHIARGGQGFPAAMKVPLRPPPIWQDRPYEYRRRAAEILHAIRNGYIEAWDYGSKMELFEV